MLCKFINNEGMSQSEAVFSAATTKLKCMSFISFFFLYFWDDAHC